MRLEHRTDSEKCADAFGMTLENQRTISKTRIQENTIF